MKSLLLTLLLVPGSWFLVPSTSAEGLNSGGPIDITSQQMDIQQSKGLAIFSGDVIVTQGSLTLTAPKVTTAYGTTSGNSDIKSIEATGGVTITRSGAGGTLEKATGTTALYSPATQQMTMTGAVTLIRGPSQLSGDKLVYDMASGNARVTNSGGPVKARFVPNAK